MYCFKALRSLESFAVIYLFIYLALRKIESFHPDVYRVVNSRQFPKMGACSWEVKKKHCEVRVIFCSSYACGSRDARSMNRSQSARRWQQDAMYR